MKITVLTENTSLSPVLQSEHGLSLFIETDNHKILFDMGQSDLFELNAERLGINLSEVDIAILSHGHYDHGGGLERFLQINKKAKVYVNKYAFEPHYSKNGYIGLNRDLEKSDRLVKISDILLLDNLTIYPSFLLPAPFGVNHYGLEALENNVKVPDDFRHEQYLMIEECDKKILFSGCSHKGILNICDYFKPDILFGGFHFMKIDLDDDGINKLKNAANFLMTTNSTYYTCHCTGLPQFEKLKEFMNDKLQYISTGSIVNIL